MLIEESYINRTENCRCGESGKYRPFTDNTGELYKSLVKEYGRCIGKIYIDTAEGVKSVGWVFQKKCKYDDCNKYYLQEVWVTLYKKEDTIIKNYKYIA